MCKLTQLQKYSLQQNQNTQKNKQHKIKVFATNTNSLMTIIQFAPSALPTVAASADSTLWASDSSDFICSATC